ncbi:putative RING finger protein P8B7.15c [Psilocybe cubensis]|uniref:DWNN-domain-containing protein n=2 Tax=Psilocybe cubensis TaxID=181762 RepID=A0A8H7XRV8_PSICU|nr:putative RING finger protein P8B7.15c [Psilocybe cubensis]KAH9479364.1 putative RING finger protein P8B7.15c [Psilocybe cubensis]
MASSVFYKFNSRKDESRVSFDGTGISVFDLKREIILANNMGKANDFDLYVYDATSKQEFKDDAQIIPRSSSVIVKRLPAARPGKGKASLYVNGGGPPPIPTSEPVSRGGSAPGGITWHKGSMSKRFDGKEEPTTVSPSKQSTPTPTPVVASHITKEDEAAAMAAMFQAQTQNWEETQEKMSQLVLPFRGFNRGGKPFQPHQSHSDKPLPPSYVCYRCGQKGHWIQDCPTNSDREFDNRPRIKRTTGIPRSMLKAVENPNSSELTQGVMVTPDGGYVVAQPDVASWQKKVARVKGLTALEVREKVPSDATLACPIDNKLFRDAVKTPCCNKAYCEECIQTYLLERDFVCPNCQKKIPSLDKLAVDKPTRTKVTDYIEKAIEESRKEGGEDGSAAKSDANGTQTGASDDANLGEQDIYSDQQPDLNMDMSQMLVDQIPQLQAQIAQISQALQNPNLPRAVRQQTELQHQQLQMQLAHAQAVAQTLALASSYQQQQVQVQQAAAAAVAAAAAGVGVPGMGGFAALGGYQQQQQQQQWNQFGGMGGQDSAYQRLPVNNRRRNLKRDRPADFFETTNPDGSKVPRYWE